MKRLVLVGHVAVDPCAVAITVCADLEPEPRTMRPGSVRITVAGGESVELQGDQAAAWWRHVEQTACHLERRILVSHGRDVKPRNGGSEVA